MIKKSLKKGGKVRKKWWKNSSEKGWKKSQGHSTNM
jgi:hypothetical protein